MLQQIELKQLLSYNSRTGIFLWKVNRGPVKIGDIAGCLSSGYRVIQVNGKPYKAHRLAWLFVFSSFPTSELDHRDRNKDNNRIKNLRKATRTIQVNNVGPRKKKSSLPQGIRLNHGSKINPYVAQLQVNGIRIHLGVFSSAGAASAAYQGAIGHVELQF